MGMFETLAWVMTAPDDTLKVAYGACGHKAVWTRRTAFDRLGADASPYTARRKLICSRRGDRLRVIVSI